MLPYTLNHLPHTLWMSALGGVLKNDSSSHLKFTMIFVVWLMKTENADRQGEGGMGTHTVETDFALGFP